jgi:site-specific DNA recombinase
MNKTVSAVGYVRMSTDRQETSPEQQRQEIESYAAKHGYRVVRWYQDLGISGDKTEKRLGFQEMIADGADGRFRAILCWDQDRFGRFDSLESGYWIHPLRQRGVRLVTVTDGVIDWDSFAGRMLYGMKQEGKHQFLVDLSNNTTRRMKQIARLGQWVAGCLPIGYRLGDDRVPILGPEPEVEMVRQAFDRYLAGESSRQLAAALTENGYPTKSGSGWTSVGVLSLLRNDIYLGRLTYGKRAFSKYQPNPGGGRFRDKSEWIVVENNHPAIVDQETFDQVQAEITKRQRHTTPAPGGGNYVLSGLLRCGHCGQSLAGDQTNNVRQYTCYSYRNRPGACERYNVKEQAALQLLLSELKDKLFRRDIIKRLRTELRRQLTTPSRPTTNVESRLAELDRKIESAEKRLVEVSRDMIPRVEQQIRELEQQRSSLLVAAEPEQKPLSPADIDGRIEKALGWFSSLEKLANTDYQPAKLRRLLREFVDRVELSFQRIPLGKRKHACLVDSGTIWLRLSSDIPEVVSSGPPILTTPQITADLVAGCLAIRFQLGGPELNRPMPTPTPPAVNRGSSGRRILGCGVK